MRPTLRAVLRNLLVLMVGILPLWFLLAWLSGGRGGTQPGGVWNAFAIGYFFVALPLLASGAVQQMLLVTLCRFTNLRTRWVAVLSVAVIPLMMGLISAPLDVQFSTRLVLATTVSLLVFGLVMKVPPRAERGSSLQP